LNKVK